MAAVAAAVTEEQEAAAEPALVELPEVTDRVETAETVAPDPELAADVPGEPEEPVKMPQQEPVAQVAMEQVPREVQAAQQLRQDKTVATSAVKQMAIHQKMKASYWAQAAGVAAEHHHAQELLVEEEHQIAVPAVVAVQVVALVVAVVVLITMVTVVVPAHQLRKAAPEEEQAEEQSV